MPITISPIMLQTLMMAIQIALMQFQKETAGMTDEELVLYLVQQEDRKRELLNKIDEV